MVRTANTIRKFFKKQLSDFLYDANSQTKSIIDIQIEMRPRLIFEGNVKFYILSRQCPGNYFNYFANT